MIGKYEHLRPRAPEVHPGKAARRTAVVAISMAVCTILISLFLAAIGIIGDWIYSNQPREAIFSYSSVEFVQQDSFRGLVMESTREWRVEVDAVAWVDQLRCDAGGQDVTYSTYATNGSQIGPSPLTTSQWVYGAAYPGDGRSCYMVSMITASDGPGFWQQTVVSSKFVPAPPAKLSVTPAD